MIITSVGDNRIIIAYSNRLLSRETKENGSATHSNSFGYTGNGDSPDFLMDSSGNVTQKYLGLPGGVSLTLKPQENGPAAVTYGLSNLHGDTMATIDGNGALLGTFMTGPFGEMLPGQTNPDNAADGSSYNYVGRYRKTTETGFSIAPVQMGARVYVPGLGRFISVDPVEGGTLNNYVYVADPVNQKDLNGKWSLYGIFTAVANSIIKKVNRVANTNIPLFPIPSRSSTRRTTSSSSSNRSSGSIWFEKIEYDKANNRYKLYPTALTRTVSTLGINVKLPFFATLVLNF